MAENRQDIDSSRKVLDAEIVDIDSDAPGHAPTYQDAYGANGTAFLPAISLQSTGGCAAGIITIAIALICLAQYGILAAIGFYAFYLAGGLIGIFVLIRRSLSLNRLTAPISFIWTWRICDWLLSYLLTAYLAGGFEN